MTGRWTVTCADGTVRLRAWGNSPFASWIAALRELRVRQDRQIAGCHLHSHRITGIDGPLTPPAVHTSRQDRRRGATTVAGALVVEGLR